MARRHSGRAKGPIYVPYPQQISLKGKKEVHIVYNGGELTFRPQQADVVMLYGASDAALPLDVLELLGTHGVPIILHRKHLPRPMWIYPGPGNDRGDILSRQVRTRDDLRKRRYIARTLLREKIKTSRWLLPFTVPSNLGTLSIQQLRTREASYARKYWVEYYRRLGHEESNRRDHDNPISAALDAVSMYQAGIILRWTLYHRLSPCHGFLHETTDYPSLVYDLIEPYRAWMDRAVFTAAEKAIAGKKDDLVARSTAIYKAMLKEPVYCPLTRQIVARKILLHGIVLALRAYLSGDMGRFCIPTEGQPLGGRPPKVSWRMPGGRAGFNTIDVAISPTV